MTYQSIERVLCLASPCLSQAVRMLRYIPHNHLTTDATPCNKVRIRWTELEAENIIRSLKQYLKTIAR